MADSGITTANVAVTDAATPLLTDVAVRRRTVWLHNLAGSDTVYLGGSNVTAATGLPIAAGEKFPIVSGEGDTDAAENWYARCASTETADVRVLSVRR